MPCMPWLPWAYNVLRVLVPLVPQEANKKEESAQFEGVPVRSSWRASAKTMNSRKVWDAANADAVCPWDIFCDWVPKCS